MPTMGCEEYLRADGIDEGKEGERPEDMGDKLL